MQTGDAAEQRYGGVGEVVVSAASVTVVNPLKPSANPYTKEILEVEDIVLTSAQSKPAQQSDFLVTASAHLESEEVELPVLQNIQLVSATDGSIDTPTAELAEPTVFCEITAEGIATKASMIELTLNAPCWPCFNKFFAERFAFVCDQNSRAAAGPINGRGFVQIE